MTYIHIPGYGWWYAVTVIDYYSRYLLAAHLTYSYSAREVVKMLDSARAEAERLCGRSSKPSQLRLLERFHKTLKEEIYWRMYDHLEHCRICLAEFRERHDSRQPHWALRMYSSTGREPFSLASSRALSKAM